MDTQDASTPAARGRAALEELVPGVPSLIDASLSGLSPNTARRIYEHIWGDVYEHNAASVRDLTLAAIGGLTALGGSDTNLMLQVSIALSLDISREEIIGVIEHAATYAGFPRAQAALQAVRGVFET